MTARDAKDADQITDSDALLPNGCELTNYIDGVGSSNKRTNCAVIIRNGSHGTASSSPINVEPLLSNGKSTMLIIFLENRTLTLEELSFKTAPIVHFSFEINAIF